MNANRTKKAEEIKELNTRFTENETIVVTHYSGLTVSDLSTLRASGREEGVEVKVTKNSLAKIALKDTQFEGLTDLFTGPTAIVTSKDAVAAAKIANNFAKENDKLVILGGAMGGTILDLDAVKALAAMPSLDELRSKIVGLLVAAPTKLVGVLQAPARDMVGVTAAYGEKSE